VVPAIASSVLGLTILVAPIGVHHRGLIGAQVVVTYVLVHRVLSDPARIRRRAIHADFRRVVQDLLPLELLRATRMDTAVWVVAVDVDPTTEDRRPMLAAMRDGLRRTDLVAAADDTTVVAVLPAKAATATEDVVARVLDEARRAGLLPRAIGHAQFPSTAVTADGLVRLALGRRRPLEGGPNDELADSAVDDSANRDRRSLHLMSRVSAAVGLVVVSPLLAVAALAIKLDSRGPVIFGQARTGRDGRPFRLYKLRTMVDGAHLRAEEIERLCAIHGVYKSRSDPRVTRVGRILRRTSIDELPQLWNVVRGDMLLIGPRPTSSPVTAHEPWQAERLTVLPGLTGLWQIEQRGACSFDDRCRTDIRYVRRRSAWLNGKILLKTLCAVVSGRGAF
jgi:lipopolysaccharide/colanic/teichoic acid biosynthesis glycosyltransferase